MALLLAVVTAHSVRDTSRAELRDADGTAPHATLVPAATSEHQTSALDLPPAIIPSVADLGVLSAFALALAFSDGVLSSRRDRVLSRGPPAR